MAGPPHPRTTWLLMLWLLTAGCATQPMAQQQAPEHLPAFHEIAQRYNLNLARTSRLWSRAGVELEWRDEQGKHYEQGDGNLIMVLPDRVALSVGKLGNPILWAGCDRERYWLFNLRDQRVLHFGRHRLSATGAKKLPIPIHPADLIALSGLLPLDANGTPAPPGVTWEEGYYVITPPGLSRKMWIDPETTRPSRIDLLGRDGSSRVTCRLSRWQAMTIHGVAPGAFPQIATRLEVSLLGREGTMTLFLSDPSDGQEHQRIKDQAFNLDRLIRALKPAKQIDLDAEKD